MLIESLLAAVFRRSARRTMHLEDFSGRSLPPRDPELPYPLLYLHIPFCRSLCPFCTFHRVRHTPTKAKDYFRALRSEIRMAHEAGYRYREVYIGGGTPTTEPRELAETLALLRRFNDISRVSVETNPSELTPGVVSQLMDAGINRLSVGVQSFDDELLRRMQRIEAYGNSDEIVRRLLAVKHRFDTVNVDMMFNLPGQTDESLRRDLHILTRELEVDQVSFYPLIAGRRARRAMRKTMGGGPAGHERRYYFTILDTMLPRYTATSAWCFSRDSEQLDEYIVDHPDYLGLGSGSFSYLGGTLYSNTFSINGYQQRMAAGLPAMTAYRALSPGQQLRYDFLMGLFSTRLRRSDLLRRHGEKALRRLALERWGLQLLGALRDDGETIRLTRRGMYLWVVMMREFFNGVNALRDDMRLHIRQERELRLPSADDRHRLVVSAPQAGE